MFRSGRQQLLGDRFPVSADDVDLDVVAARQVTADHRRGGDALGGQQARERFANQRLDSSGQDPHTTRDSQALPAPRGYHRVKAFPLARSNP